MSLSLSNDMLEIADVIAISGIEVFPDDTVVSDMEVIPVMEVVSDMGVFPDDPEWRDVLLDSSES